MLDGKQIKLQFAVITKAKTSVVEVHEVDFDAVGLQRLRTVFSQVWGAIKSGNIFPAPSQMNCHSCGYKNACQVWNGKEIFI